VPALHDRRPSWVRDLPAASTGPNGLPSSTASPHQAGGTCSRERD